VLDEKGAAVSNTGSNIVLNVRRNWSDAFHVRAGVSYWTAPDRSLELFAGAGFDANAVPDATLEATLPDSHRIAGALGVRAALSKTMHLAGSYTHMHYVGRNNIGRSELTRLDLPSKFPDAGGVYNSWIGIVNANIEVAF
jgi:long-chain fatty acid transport protein